MSSTGFHYAEIRRLPVDMYETKDHLNMFFARLNVITIFIIILSLVLMFRVWDLQILRGNEFQTLSEKNRLRDVRIIAPRGNIYDCNGTLLAYDSPSFNLYVLKEDVEDMDIELGLICDLMGYSWDRVSDMKKRLDGISSYIEYPLIKNLSFEEVSKIESRYSNLPGFMIKVAPLRKYDFAEPFVHVLGYMREIDRISLERLSQHGYRTGDYIGVTGVESSLNAILKGSDGNRIIEVDALGREIFEISSISPKRGNNVFLTIDKDFQIFCYDLLEKYRSGAIIVMDVRNGDLLVLISKPGFNPNTFFPEVSLVEWQKLIRDPLKPLQDRSISGLYSPGSVFKTVLAFAGLSEGIITEKSTFYCGGAIRLKNRIYNCWKSGGHGSMNVVNALAESCNVFFYQLGDRLGIEKIHDYGIMLGLGEKTGIILPNENTGLVPNSEWKLRTRNEPWYPGETISVSIGQGSLLVTPIQLAVMMGFVATEGMRIKPRLIGRIEDYRGLELENDIDPVSITDNRSSIDSIHIKTVKKGLEKVFSHQRGTARGAFIPGLQISGKTGTSQIASLSKIPKDNIPYQLRNHNFLVSFAKRDKPTIAVVVFIAHGGEDGGRDRVSITKAIYEYYYEKYGD